MRNAYTHSTNTSGWKNLTLNNSVLNSRSESELSNHLGNVLSTISDRKVWNSTDSHYEAVVTSWADYFSFGMIQPNEDNLSGGYRYGFNGAESDDEVKGEGNSLDFGARMYDSRVGRWLSKDPQAKKQPGWSPYKAMLDNPIIYSDPDGETEYLEIIFNDKSTGKSVAIKMVVSDDLLASHVFKNLTVHYSDYTRTLEINLNKDGSVRTRNYVATGAERAVAAVGTPMWIVKKAAYGWGGVSQKGGFQLTSKDGGASPTKTISENDVETRDIGALLDALGGLKNGSLGSDVSDLIMTVTDIIENVNDLIPNEGSRGTGEGSSESAGSQGNNKDEDTTITINQYEYGGAYTINHVKDTVVKKSDVEKVNQNREYNEK